MFVDDLNQWFSTFGNWRVKMQNYTQYGNQFISNIVKLGFGDPKVSTR